jgi:predicted outer membrane protein
MGSGTTAVGRAFDETRGGTEMKMSRLGSAAIVMLALELVVTGAGHATDDRNPAEMPGGVQPSPLPSAKTQDEDFVTTSSGLLLPEIDASKLGAEKARDPEVKALSGRMAESYSELARKLEVAARSAGLEPAHTQDPHGVHRVQRLQDAGPQFDLAFLAEEASWHKKLIAIYSMEERAGQNEALKTHAEEGRALLTKNYEEIERLQARLREERTTPGR